MSNRILSAKLYKRQPNSCALAGENYFQTRCRGKPVFADLDEYTNLTRSQRSNMRHDLLILADMAVETLREPAGAIQTSVVDMVNAIRLALRFYPEETNLRTEVANLIENGKHLSPRSLKLLREALKYAEDHKVDPETLADEAATLASYEQLK